MRPIREGELSQAQIVGNIAFQSHAQQVCKLMPEIITSGGVQAYNIDVKPYCTDGKGKFHFAPISFKNPCKQNRQDLGWMSVDTSPANCKKGWVAPTNVQGTATPAAEVPNMAPLACPPGYRAARRAELASFIRSDLLNFFTYDNQILPILDAQSRSQWCSEVGFKRIDVNSLSGCIAQTPGSPTAGIMAQGVFRYVCTNQARIRTLGLTISGDYLSDCQAWEVEIDK